MDTLPPSTQITTRKLAKEFGKRVINIHRYLRRVKNSLPVSESQSFVLTLLMDKRPWRISDLAVAEGVRVPSITELVSRMERQGLVSKSDASGDLRGVEVLITEKGRELMQNHLRQYVELMTRRLGQLTNEEKEAILNVLPVLDRLFGEPSAHQLPGDSDAN
jgi:DNA-binding MarR family transcriptional regulator